MMDLTTLQLARRIADAVLVAVQCDSYPEQYDAWLKNDKQGMGDLVEIAAPLAESLARGVDHEDKATQAVLRTLHETDSWFCRLSNETVFTATLRSELATLPGAAPIEPPVHVSAAAEPERVS